MKIKHPTAQEVAAANVASWEQGFDDGFYGRPKADPKNEFYRIGHRAGARVKNRDSA